MGAHRLFAPSMETIKHNPAGPLPAQQHIMKERQASMKHPTRGLTDCWPPLFTAHTYNNLLITTTLSIGKNDARLHLYCICTAEIDFICSIQAIGRQSRWYQF